MEPFVYKIALMVLSKALKLQGVTAQNWEDGYKNRAEFSRLNCWFLDAWDCLSQGSPRSVKGLIFLKHYSHLRDQSLLSSQDCKITTFRPHFGRDCM